MAHQATAIYCGHGDYGATLSIFRLFELKVPKGVVLPDYSFDGYIVRAGGNIADDQRGLRLSSSTWFGSDSLTSPD